MTSKLETIIEFVNSTPSTGGGGESGGGTSSGGISGAVETSGISPFELASYQSTGATQTFDILGIAIFTLIAVALIAFGVILVHKKFNLKRL